MKKRGVKRKVNSRKSSSFFEENKFLVVFAAVFLVFILALIFVSVKVSYTGGTVITGQAEASIQSTPEWLIKTLAFTMGDPFKNAEQNIKLAAFRNAPLGVTGIVIVYIMVWAILFFGFSYIFADYLFTSQKLKVVPWVVGFAMATIAANFGLITIVVAFMAAVTAALGAFSVFASMGMAFVFFFLVTFFQNKARLWSAKKTASQAEAGGVIAGAGVRVLKEVAEKASK